jgi:2-oxoglutarate dehydrogenase E2 component (dihydrolipoamide succinyltransferase)
LRWLKAVGEMVTQHEPLLEIETDKVTVEVPAPASGVLREITKAEQEEIAPGDVLGRIESAGDAPAAAADVREVAGARVEGAQLQTSAVGRTDSAPFSTATVEDVQGRHAPAEGASEPPSAIAPRAATQALSPAVRRLLAERALEASQVRGTGEGGRITVEDVLAHHAPAEGAAAVVSAVNARSDTPPQRATSHSVPHPAVRKRIAEHMVQSLLHTAPHVTTVFEADLSAVIAHRSTYREPFQQRGVPLTFTAYFLAASVEAIKAVPEANSRWTDTALEIYEDIHIGVATAVEGVGLVVPVVRDVPSLDLFGIASRLDHLVNAARGGRLEPADVRGGTFTISNHGVSGSLLATPIVINQPQSAILGIGKLEKRPVVVEDGDKDEIVVRPKCYVTLTIDHRVMDGHQANRFLQTFVSALESWPRDA